MDQLYEPDLTVKTHDLWESDRHGSWGVTLEWQALGGILECVGFRLFPHLAARPITAKAVRDAPIGAMVDEGRAEALKQARRDAVLADHGLTEPVKARGRRAKAVASKIDDPTAERLLKVAALYAIGCHLVPRNPKGVVQNALHVSKSRAGTLVGEARNDRHFLVPTEPRKPNGRLTDGAAAALVARGVEWIEHELAAGLPDHGADEIVAGFALATQRMG